MMLSGREPNARAGQARRGNTGRGRITSERAIERGIALAAPEHAVEAPSGSAGRDDRRGARDAPDERRRRLGRHTARHTTALLKVMRRRSALQGATRRCEQNSLGRREHPRARLRVDRRQVKPLEPGIGCDLRRGPAGVD